VDLKPNGRNVTNIGRVEWPAQKNKKRSFQADAFLIRERPLFHTSNPKRKTMTTRNRTLPRPTEVREIFCNYVNANMDDDIGSYREIAETVSRMSGRYTSHATVVRWMKAEFPYVAASMSENSPHFARATA
jgi:hypothetical protein